MKLIAYTDGSSSLKRGTCGWGVLMIHQGNEVRLNGGMEGTNQFAELYAIIHVLRIVPKHIPLKIISDSQFALKGLTEWRRRWKANGFKNAKGDTVAHSALFQEGHSLIDSFDDIEFMHIRGHQGEPGNEEADRLAKAGRDDFEREVK